MSRSGSSHSTSLSVKRVMPYACPACGYQTSALVTGIGQAPRAARRDPSLSPAEVRLRGEESAHENARLTLSLARCPRCGRRDEAALRALYRRMATQIVAAVVGCVCAGLGLCALLHRPVGMVIVAPFTAGATYNLWTGARWRWQGLEERVAFLPPEATP
jgi:hypothetical protein